MTLLENVITFTSTTEENLNEDNKNKGNETPPNIISPAILEEFENMIRRDINVN